MIIQADVIKQAIDQAVERNLSTVWWHQAVIIITSIATSIAMSTLVAYLISYGKKKGENYATKEDFEKLLEQVKKTTSATEEIKTDISNSAWVNQQRWDLRKDLYLLLLENLNEVKFTIGEVLKASQDSFDGNDNEKEQFINRLLERNGRAGANIKKAVALSGILFLSESALQVLGQYEMAEMMRLKRLRALPDPYGDINAEATSMDSYLESELEAACKAYDEIVRVAKEDLQIKRDKE